MDKITEFKSLKELLDGGAITQVEFDKMKNEILNGSQSPVQEKEKIEDSHSDIIVKNPGTIMVSFEGQYFIFDAKTKIFLNGNLHSTHSTKKGFAALIPFSDDSIELKVSVAGLKSTIYNIDELDVKKEYFLTLEYDTTWGKYSNNFKFTENGKN